MLRWSAVFLLIALAAGALGIYGLAGEAAGIAKGLFACFLALFLVSGVAGVASGLIRRDRHHRPLHR
jgi:uncharacterized membrane protein YtjA (UPF0391 family)